MSKEFINSLPIIYFKGEIFLVNNNETLLSAVSELSKKEIIGFDTESKPSFKKGVSFPVSLIQLSTEDRAYLFQINRIPNLQPLYQLLADENIKKIGIGLEKDFEKLTQHHPIKPEGFIDLSQLAQNKGIIQSGAKNLAARYLGYRISKNAQTSNWAKRVLSYKQMVYGATDAWICIKIFPLLQKDTINYQNID